MKDTPAQPETTKCATCRRWLGDCTLGALHPAPVKPAPMPYVVWCGGYEEERTNA